MIELIKPTIEYQDDIFAYKKEMINHGNTALNGCGGLEKYDNYHDWMSHILSYSIKDQIKDSNYVEGSQWILVDTEKKRVLGMVNIRHELNDYLRQAGGHIGYSIRPSERNKGYGKLQLTKALAFLKTKGVREALVTCNDNNIGSYKTIESCHGILDNKIVIDGETVRRYFIQIGGNDE
jgi:predicted acetyltransferase